MGNLKHRRRNLRLRFAIDPASPVKQSCRASGVGAARMVEYNPPLLQLRLLQQLGATNGNSVVLGNTVILPVTKQECRPAKDKKSPPPPTARADSGLGGMAEHR